jgi:hypothetical protein
MNDAMKRRCFREMERQKYHTASSLPRHQRRNDEHHDCTARWNKVAFLYRK